jgi:dihydroorotase
MDWSDLDHHRVNTVGGDMSETTQKQYNLLLKQGHVIDPKNGVDGVMDVAVADGKIACVAEDIPDADAENRVDVSGLYVTPGLVDIHVHAYAGTGMRNAYCGDQSVYPDGFNFRTGVTTVLDVGSSGWRNFPDFKDRVIDRARTRVFALLNIVGHGMGGGAIEQNQADMEPKATAEVAEQYPEIVVGIKTAHYSGPEWLAVDRAVEAGTLTNLPVMVDFGAFLPERPYQEMVLEHTRPGDISTHMYSGRVPLFDENGQLLPYLAEARERGVKFDVGHGAGSFSWSQAIPAIEQGWIPDSISTDLHTGSMNGGMKDMVTTMSKILNQDISLYDVIKMSTIDPALLINRPEFGHLSVGAGADVAVLKLNRGEFGFLDVRNTRFIGDQKLECELTLRDGRVEWDLNGRAGVDWQQYNEA